MAKIKIPFFRAKYQPWTESFANEVNCNYLILIASDHFVQIKDSNKSGMCQASDDFAVFSKFGLHRRGDPLKSKNFFWSKAILLR